MQINLNINIDDRIIKYIRNKKNIIIVFSGIFVFLGITIYAAQTITKPWTFNTGDLIEAEKINDNFDALYTKINELAAVTSSTSLGDFQEIVSETIYHATTDGFVFGVASRNNNQTVSEQTSVLNFYMHHSTFNPYTTPDIEVRLSTPWIIPAKTTVQLPFCYPVKKGKYWSARFYTDEKVYWMPLGN